MRFIKKQEELIILYLIEGIVMPHLFSELSIDLNEIFDSFNAK